MRKYEVVYIVHPDLDSSAFKELNKTVEGWIKENGGKVTKSDVWGKRRLAYPIRKQNEGQYVLLEAEMEPAYCSELERSLRLQESVMRHLVTQAQPAAAS
jgi:small subunit ribosomal protein S6